MTFNDAGMALLKSFERCELKAYQDQGGVWTIGWGHTGSDVFSDMTISQEQADGYLAADVQRTVDELLDVIIPELSDNRFSSQVVFAFNIGSGAYEASSALDCINAGRLEEVPSRMLRWVKVRIDGVLHISRGLLRRRQAEIALWDKG